MTKNILYKTAILMILFIPSPSFGLKPAREYEAIPSDYGIICKEVSIKTTDDLILEGWFYPAQDTIGISNDIIGRLIPVPQEMKKPLRKYLVKFKEQRPTIIICDGDAGNMTFLLFYAYHFFTDGYNVLTFDWRGFGGSSDWPMEESYLSYKEFIDDYDAAIDFVKKMPEVDTTRLGVLGFSTGAYLSFSVFAKRNDIQAYCGRALLTSFDDIIPILRNIDPLRKFKAPVGYPKGLLPINAAKSIKRPVFLIVGEKDNRTPPWMSEKIMKELKGPKELWIVPEAEHGGGKGPEMLNYPEFFTRVISFFDRNLPAQE